MLAVKWRVLFIDLKKDNYFSFEIDDEIIISEHCTISQNWSNEIKIS